MHASAYAYTIFTDEHRPVGHGWVKRNSHSYLIQFGRG